MTNTMTWTTSADAFGPGLLLARDLPRYAARGTTSVAVLPAPMGGGAPVAGDSAPMTATGPSGAVVIRSRGSIAAAGTTGSHLTGVAFPKATEQLNSTVPGEQPPRDPLGD